MSELQKKYKRTVTIAGATLIIWLLLFTSLIVLVDLVMSVLMPLFEPTAFEITYMTLQGAAYLIGFILPTLFFRLMSVNKKIEPIRLGIKLPSDSMAWIIGGIACALSFSLLNGMIMNLIEIPESGEIISEAAEKVSDHSLILQFITIALVPAFCEEFLFRGVILSNLMPYGKGLAIIVSAILFGLMHGNFYQFLYTTVAGIILGLIYVVTESIWCSVLLHMINNSLSVIQSSLLGRLSEELGELIWTLVVVAIFLAGIICVTFLVIKYSKGDRAKKAEELGIVRGLDSVCAIRGLLNPTILVFAGFSVLDALLVLFSV